MPSHKCGSARALLVVPLLGTFLHKIDTCIYTLRHVSACGCEENPLSLILVRIPATEQSVEEMFHKNWYNKNLAFVLFNGTAFRIDVMS